MWHIDVGLRLGSVRLKDDLEGYAVGYTQCNDEYIDISTQKRPSVQTAITESLKSLVRIDNNLSQNIRVFHEFLTFLFFKATVPLNAFLDILLIIWDCHFNALAYCFIEL